jgi:hypothetical protein
VCNLQNLGCHSVGVGIFYHTILQKSLTFNNKIMHRFLSVCQWDRLCNLQSTPNLGCHSVGVELFLSDNCTKILNFQP